MQEPTFQDQSMQWATRCFGPARVQNPMERNHRFLEESLELIHAAGYTIAQAHRMVEYVFNRPQGTINQEVGGVLITLATLCGAHDIDMLAAGEAELAKIQSKTDAIFSKHQNKPTDIRS